MALVSNKIRPIVAVGEELVKTMKASEFNKLLNKMADAVKGGTTADEFYNTHKNVVGRRQKSCVKQSFFSFCGDRAIRVEPFGT